MDYKKIGNFIATERQSSCLTQSEFAKQLNIDETTLIKYENGKIFPDCELLPKICEILNISITELVNGERNANRENLAESEQLILSQIKENQSLKRKISQSQLIFLILGIISFTLITIFSMLMLYSTDYYSLSVIFMLIGTSIFTFCCIMYTLLDHQTGCYTCGKCGHKHKPKFIKVLFSLRMNTTLYLKCPHCKCKSWQKKTSD